MEPDTIATMRLRAGSTRQQACDLMRALVATGTDFLYLGQAPSKTEDGAVLHRFQLLHPLFADVEVSRIARRFVRFEDGD